MVDTNRKCSGGAGKAKYCSRPIVADVGLHLTWISCDVFYSLTIFKGNKVSGYLMGKRTKKQMVANNALCHQHTYAPIRDIKIV